MLKKSVAALMAATMLAGTLAQTAAAQPGYGPRGIAARSYEDGYRDGYREGYEDGRNRVRYDDRIAGPGPNNYDLDQRWRQRYQRDYTYNDDVYYRECRTQVDPGGVIAGALIGGLLGNALGRGGGRGGATVAGVVVGGALGAAMTRNMDCEDRSYAYRTYYDGFNSGRANAEYEWRNPQNGHYGRFRVRDYYTDPVGFRCANFTQEIFINGRPQAASGRACQQPDGTWAVVG